MILLKMIIAQQSLRNWYSNCNHVRWIIQLKKQFQLSIFELCRNWFELHQMLRLSAVLFFCFNSKISTQSNAAQKLNEKLNLKSELEKFQKPHSESFKHFWAFNLKHKFLIKELWYNLILKKKLLQLKAEASGDNFYSLFNQNLT